MFFRVVSREVVYGLVLGSMCAADCASEHQIELPKKIWCHLNLSWALFFSMMGAINLYVIYHFNTDTWVNFKLFGTLGLTLIFVVIQGLYMAKYHKIIVSNEKIKP